MSFHPTMLDWGLNRPYYSILKLSFPVNQRLLILKETFFGISADICTLTTSSLAAGLVLIGLCNEIGAYWLHKILACNWFTGNTMSTAHEIFCKPPQLKVLLEREFVVIVFYWFLFTNLYQSCGKKCRGTMLHSSAFCCNL